MDSEKQREREQMDYLVTFDDGSSTHLEHFGKKGMKWGVWNAETAARYNGGDNSTHRGAKKTVRDANKLDARRAVEIGKANKEHKLGQQALAKAEHYRKMGDYRTAHGYDVAHVGRAIRRDQHIDAAKGIQKSRDKLIKSLDKSSYNVKVKDVQRTTWTQGKQTVTALLVGGTAASMLAYSPKNTTAGKQYQLSRKKA